MFFHRRENTKITLHTPVVVVANIIFNHIDQFFPAGKAPTVIAFPFQDAPKALHGTVVNALRYTGHALCHSGFLQFCMEGAVGILKSSVAME